MSEPHYTIDLPALDGANPLGFLAALGTLTLLAETDPSIKLGWHARARWVPCLVSRQPIDEQEILTRLEPRLRGQEVSELEETKRAASQKNFDIAKKSLKKAKDQLAALKLKGKQLEDERERLVFPFVQELERRRREVLAQLRKAVPSPELALGQRPDCNIEEYRNIARSLCREAMSSTRSTVDLLASFGSEVSNRLEERITPTQFCFITGSGSQWFLDTARVLMSQVSVDKLREALFQPWAYEDEKLSMRWDPHDDRRYALMDRDPTSSDNKSATVWMANLLAYVALVNFPCAVDRHGPATSGWIFTKDTTAFNWPIWRSPLTSNTIRSLLCQQAFVERGAKYEFRQSSMDLRSRGVHTVFSARRIQVGTPPLHKINFAAPVAR